MDKPSQEMTRKCQCGGCGHVSTYQFVAGMTYYQSWYQACEKCGKKNVRHYDEKVMDAE